jgi:DNA invertase Pin-like site-specific DNA recombinase
MAAHKPTAVAYYRTSSAANVGADKDSLVRQRSAVEQFAKRQGYRIVREFYDAAVSGADAIDARPGFSEMLSDMLDNGARVILVETASRFARDLMVQMTGHRLLQAHGIEVIPVDAPSFFSDPGPTAELVRQILGAVSEFEKAMLVAKLRSARERKRAAGQKCEGRKSRAEMAPDAVALAKRLYRRHPKTGQRRSLREIARLLTEAGHVNAKGNPYPAAAIRSMVQSREA